MVSIVHTVAFSGIEARPVDVQVQIAGGLSAFTIVGLPDKAVSEARERVRAALNAIGLALPYERITVNLSPADLPKEGSHYDLPIALGLMMAMEVIDSDSLTGFIAMGELGLDATISRVPGVLPAALYAAADTKGIICPFDCGSEAAWAGETVEILAPASLMTLLNHFRGQSVLERPKPKQVSESTTLPDLRDIKGQESAKRALEIAACGGHTLLMTGPPGSGKSMLAARMPSILPALTAKEVLEVSMIASIAGEIHEDGLTDIRPFRSPHHSASQPALIGGGSKGRPGEVSLAHGGVLFLDELPEFNRSTLEALRQPLESGKAVIARVQAHVTYPAEFQLIAAMNPCKCGYLDDASMACNRAPKCALDYQMKISGPLYDRIDLHVDVPAVSALDLTLPAPREGSAEVLARVTACRDRQQARFDKAGINCSVNARADGELLDSIAALDSSGQKLMEQAIREMKLSARGYHRVLKVARTIADMASADAIKDTHLAEALGYRRLSPQAVKLT